MKVAHRLALPAGWWSKLACALACVTACAQAPAHAEADGRVQLQEPPDHPTLQCRLLQQAAAGAWRLQLRLENRGSEPVELRPGAQIALYRDAAAADAWQDTARADRLQRTPLVLAPGAVRSEWFVMEAAAGQALRCAGRTAAAAALYFYRFEPRPLFRCRIEDFAAPPAEGCAAP